MRKYIFIGIGGASGSITRAFLESIHIYNYKENIPLNTLLINLTGSFLLSLILTIALEIWAIDADIRIGITTGFIGSYTTFSTLCKETFKLLEVGDYFSALNYLTISTVLGLILSYYGIVVAREVIAKRVGSNNNNNDDTENITDLNYNSEVD
ncbi:fluoride efflux transporter CrcB [Caldicellulosiruptoraceae bacterium PP1]